MPIYIESGEYLTAQEAAERARVNGQRIRQLCAAGQIGAIRIGQAGSSAGLWLIPVAALDEWAATRQRGRPRVRQ